MPGKVPDTYPTLETAANCRFTAAFFRKYKRSQALLQARGLEPARLARAVLR